MGVYTNSLDICNAAFSIGGICDALCELINVKLAPSYKDIQFLTEYLVFAMVNGVYIHTFLGCVFSH